jgi:integrase
LAKTPGQDGSLEPGPTAIDYRSTPSTAKSRIQGADQENPAERPALTVAQVMALAGKVPERHRALILLATFACLRWGEVAALQRCDVDLVSGTVRVREAFTELRGKGMVLGPPKSKAGSRTVSIPASIVPDIKAHLETRMREWPNSFVFTTEGGRTIWRGNFNKIVKWRKVVGEIGRPGLHFHDLRPTGNTPLPPRPGPVCRRQPA